MLNVNVTTVKLMISYIIDSSIGRLKHGNDMSSLNVVQIHTQKK